MQQQKHHAATLIQKVFRGYIVRQQITKLKRQIYYSLLQPSTEYGFIIQPQQVKKKSSKSNLNQKKQNYINNCIIRIQKYFRGHLSRKYICDFKKLKAIILYIEQHIYVFLRKRIQQRKLKIKQLQAQCYNVASQCKIISKQKVELGHHMTRKMYDEINGTMFNALLGLVVPNFDKLNLNQRNFYIEGILNVCTQQPTKKQNSKTIKTPIKVQNISVLSGQENIPQTKNNLTNEQFKQMLQSHKRY
ncbi:hypothetical protein pb186bvf_019163 [Paramecium bursaria]